MSIRIALLSAAKTAGGLTIARALSPKGLRVLCYHGYSIGDECRFRPKLFITRETFERRLLWLLQARFEPVSLKVGLDRLVTGRLSGREVVITIDDGFFSVKAVGWPLLKKHGFPATLYVTSYYTQHPNPIFRLAVQYMLWKTTLEELDVTKLSLSMPHGQNKIRIQPTIDDHAAWRLIEFCESQLTEDERISIGASIGEMLGVDYDELKVSRRLGLLTGPELTGLHGDGLDIQLHTHRHRLPTDPSAILKEISDNRRVLEPLVNRALTHLCYPSGIWSEDQWPVLRRAGIESAMTCEPGINVGGTPMLGLRRFLDAEDLESLEFEAEMSGLKEMARRLLRRPSRRGSAVTAGNY
jgi:peptidoglycan/xylan/chitin deacetylase (PgdA/CDA1 family)